MKDLLPTHTIVWWVKIQQYYCLISFTYSYSCASTIVHVPSKKPALRSFNSPECWLTLCYPALLQNGQLRPNTCIEPSSYYPLTGRTVELEHSWLIEHPANEYLLLATESWLSKLQASATLALSCTVHMYTYMHTYIIVMWVYCIYYVSVVVSICIQLFSLDHNLLLQQNHHCHQHNHQNHHHQQCKF